MRWLRAGFLWACRSQHSCVCPVAATSLRRCQNPTRHGLPWLWLFATTEVSRPHRQWPCGSLWLHAPHQLIGRAGDAACSCFVSVDLSVSALGVLLRVSTSLRCLSLPVMSLPNTACLSPDAHLPAPLGAIPTHGRFSSVEQRGQVHSSSVAVWRGASKRLWWRAICQHTPQLLHHAHQK
jgi:hypothetical protein